ncbi:MAG: hypothetical protein ACTSX1_04740 [Candidatus Heimdallarchaeaceae archaeon]
MDWHKLAWVKRGKRRKEILIHLLNSKIPQSTKDIKNSLNIAMSQASFSISELEQNGLIICMNPTDKIGKIYDLSEEGTAIILKLLEDSENVSR